jgi:flavin-dependent dehydrogenase
MHSHLELDDGSRVAVMGGGPAGSFFSYFLLQIAQRAGLDLWVDVYEPRDFSAMGPKGCNMCGGIISESLVQSLAAEGINLPSTVVQRGIDSYFLHMDVGSVRIDTPLQEMRIAAVHRGAGPRGAKGNTGCRGFDGYLLELALAKGAHHVRSRVDGVAWDDGRPRVKTQDGREETYDLLAVATGVNTPALKLFEEQPFAFKPPQSTKTYICEFYMGRETIQRHLGGSMHVFLLNIPRLEFAALIPKGDYVTMCLLGRDIDKELVQSFMNSREVKQCLPPGWQVPADFCHCSPKLNIRGATNPFADRLVFVGDCGVTRLFKDGIGAAYRTAKAAAITAVFEGLSAEDFRRHFWPACQYLATDNRIGRLVFAVTRQIQERRFLRRGVWRMVAAEQQKEGGRRRMSMVLWDAFTGSAPYRSVFLRSLHPAFWLRLLWEALAGSWPFGLSQWERRRPWTRVP